MSEVFFTSDLHFGHKKMADLRGFDSINSHDMEIINNFNACVGKHDTTFILGDIAMNTSHIHKLGMMNGHKIVVLGNHDSRRVPVIKKFAQRIEGVATKKIGETRTVMTHIPVHPDELIRWEVNIHGHLHDKAIMYSVRRGTFEDARYINVSLERWEFFPASRTEITRLMQLRGYA